MPRRRRGLLPTLATLLALATGCLGGPDLPPATPPAAPTAAPTATAEAALPPTAPGVPTLPPSPTSPPLMAGPTPDLAASATAAAPILPAPTAAGSATPATPPAAAGNPRGCPPALSPPLALGHSADPYYPELGNAGYAPQHYTLDLDVRVAGNTLTGTTTMQARALEDLPAFNLDLHGFAVGAVTVDGLPAGHARAGDELTITPAQPLLAGALFTSTVAYAGVPRPIVPRAIDMPTGWVGLPAGSYVASEPTGASSWYPVDDHPCDKASYTFRVTVPVPYVVAANGRLAATEDHGAARTYVWQEDAPMASYLATVDIADYVVQTGTGPNGLPMVNYFPRALAGAAGLTFAAVPDMLTLFSDRFGPFPFSSYGAIVVDSDLGFALETQTRSLFDANVARAGEASGEEIAHELAHQWFGDSVSLQSWKEIWLNEGFASFAQLLWTEHTKGTAARDAEADRWYHTLSARAPSPPGSPPPDDLFNTSVYLRGGLSLQALRGRVGDATFFRILQTYAARYRYGNAETPDFITVAQEVSGQDLQAFFTPWLYGAPLPSLQRVLNFEF